jgi:pimeloyl-ACP methyl ester carboxylesterase
LFQNLLLGNPEQRAASQYMRDFRDPANDALVREHGLAALLFKAVKWERSSGMEDAERDALLADWQDRDACFGMLNWYRASPITVPSMDEPFDLPPFNADIFPKLHTPTLVIWALDDLALPPANLEGMEQLIPTLRIVQVPGCGHFVPWEAPEAVNAAMTAWLTETG